MVTCESTEVGQVWTPPLHPTPDGLPGLLVRKDSATLFLTACRIDCIYLIKENLPRYYAQERVLTTRRIVWEAASEY